MSPKALFLDRDGVINVDHGYVYQPEKFDFIPGVLEACAKMHRAGYQLIVVTNQSGISRGYYSETQFAELSQWMKARFEQAGAPITDVFYCPHHPLKGNPPYLKECDCRKPEAGMLFQAAAKHDIDLSQSIMVGDKAGDMQAGRTAGVKQCILVRSGKVIDNQGMELADIVVDDLSAGVELLLG